MNRTRAIFFLAAACACLLTAGASAQTPAAQTPVGVDVLLKDGKQVTATGFQLVGPTLLVTQQVGAGVGKVGYLLTNIDKVDFPEPPQVTSALAQLADGKGKEALAAIEPIVAYYGPLRYVPGNWWLPAALVKADVLASLGQERDVDALLAELAQLTTNPAAAEAVRLRTAEAAARRNKPELAEKAFDELLKTSSRDEILARSWIGKGSVLLARREFEPALLAYLHVPVFYPENRQYLDDAQLGGGRAFAGLGDADKAREAFEQIIRDYPNSAVAAAAKDGLQKLASK